MGAGLQNLYSPSAVTETNAYTIMTATNCNNELKPYTTLVATNYITPYYVPIIRWWMLL